MWQAETVLWIVVGAHRVDCGRSSRRRAQSSLELLSTQPIAAPEGKQSARDLMLEAVSATVNTVDAALGDAGAQPRPATLRVLLSDRWAPLATLPWSSMLSDTHTGSARSYATDHFQAAGFEVAPGDTIRMEDAGYLQPVVAVAYGRDLLATLQACAQRWRVELASVQALNCLAWRAARGASVPAALAILDGGRISLLHLRRGAPGWTPGQTLECSSTAQAKDSVMPLWRRQQLRRPQLGDTPPQVFDLDSPGAANGLPGRLDVAALSTRELSSSALDAIQLAPRWTMARSLAAGTAVAVAAIAVWQAAAATHALGDQERTLASRQVAVAPSAPKAWTDADRNRVRAVNAGIRELNLPLPALTRALSPPKDIGVAVVALEIAPLKSERGASQSMSITVDAVTALDMTRYLSFLSERPTIAAPRLVSHEILESDATKPYRFTVEVSWQI